MEDTTTLGASQAAIFEPNQHSSPESTVERPSDPTRSSQTSLCNICARGLILDDSRAGGALEKPRNDGAPSLCFPLVGKEGIWEGGAQYEQRHLTPPHLPELSDECKVCCAVKKIFLDELRPYEWWQTITTKLRFKVQYQWFGKKRKGGQLEFELFSLKSELTHPKSFFSFPIQFPITTSSSKLTL